MSRLFGVDLSSWQGEPIDFAAVRRAGNAFAVTRWGIGLRGRDRNRFTNLHGARAAGLLPGAYLVLSEHQDPAEQAAAFAGEIASTLGHDEPCLYVLDAERSATAGNPRPHQVHTFLRTLEGIIDRVPIAYIPRWWILDQRWDQGDIDRIRHYPWWASQYPGRPIDFGHERPADVGSWSATFWQYTDKASVPGIPELCDHNVFFGTIGELRDLAIPNDLQEDDDMPSADEVRQIVREELAADRDVPVIVKARPGTAPNVNAAAAWWSISGNGKRHITSELEASTLAYAGQLLPKGWTPNGRPIPFEWDWARIDAVRDLSLRLSADQVAAVAELVGSIVAGELDRRGLTGPPAPSDAERNAGVALGLARALGITLGEAEAELEARRDRVGEAIIPTEQTRDGAEGGA